MQHIQTNKTSTVIDNAILYISTMNHVMTCTSELLFKAESSGLEYSIRPGLESGMKFGFTDFIACKITHEWQFHILSIKNRQSERCFVSKEQEGKIEAFLRRSFRFGFSQQLFTFRQIAEKADNTLFTSDTNPTHCLYQLLPPTCST